MKYVGNGIYDYIDKHSLNNKYKFFSDNLWLLLYGDKTSVPKCLVIISEIDGQQLDVISEEEISLYEVTRQLQSQVKLPVIIVRYIPGSDLIQMSVNWEPFIDSTYSDLFNIYRGLGLVANGTVYKETNQYLSSSYHGWQRKKLGNITVSDLDLIELDNEIIVNIFELKRSLKELNPWFPYAEDYPNFALIINALSGTDISFELIYNVYTKPPIGPRVDITDRVKHYAFEVPNYFIDIDNLNYNLIGLNKLSNILN